MAYFKLIYRLFKFPFLFVGILYFITLIFLLSVISLKEAYKNSLENEFAAKQPHIKMVFIDDNIQKTPLQIENDIKNISFLSDLIYKISPFVEKINI